MSDPNSHPAGSPSLLSAPHSPAGSKPRLSLWTLWAHLSLPEPFWTRWNPPSDSPGCPSHQANRLPPGLMLPSALPLLSRHTPLAAAAPLSLASTAAPFSLVPHPPLHPTPTPTASSCCSQPLTALVLSPLQEKHPASQCLELCVTLGRHPVLEMEEAPCTWGALSPVSREGASAHTRTVWVHKPTTPAHVHTCTSTHSPQTCTHTHANTHSHSSTATHYTPYREVHTHVHR